MPDASGLVTIPPARDPSALVQDAPSTGRAGSIPRAYDDSEDMSRTSQTALIVAKSAQADRVILTVLTGISAGQVVRLTGEEAIVGRSHDCVIRLQDIGVSRHHCRIFRDEDGRFILEDLNSTNGTYVHGRKSSRVALMNGARVQVGPEVVLRFSFGDDTEEALARKLYEAATRDPLTMAYTRKFFDERLASEISFAKRKSAPLAVISLDIDHFKRINDTHGHAAGDQTLRHLSMRIQGLIRNEDIFARYGGEEFLILARGIKHKEVVKFAERVRKSIEKMAVPIAEGRLKITISLGVASLSECKGEGDVARRLLTLADRRLYAAKAGGRNRTFSG